jgi:DNA ligase-1
MAGNFLMHGTTFKEDKHSIAGAFVSEKLDGTRCFWDGGVSRGMPTTSIPWANIRDPKTGELKKKILPVASGLWSRYGNPIIAPDWFLNELPSMPLDGELWAGRGNFQESRSIVGRDEPDERWRDIQFVVYGCPSPANVFAQRDIKGANIDLRLEPGVIMAFIEQRLEAGVAENYTTLDSTATFAEELALLNSCVPTASSAVHVLRQYQLSHDEEAAKDGVKSMMDRVIQEGGEGVMIRKADSLWLPKRTKDLLKVKPCLDDQSVITGFTSGRETNKGSKFRGKIGALITNYKGKRLELSGMKDCDRLFLTREMEEEAHQNPGKDMPEYFQGLHFKVGDTVEFEYVELTEAGIPRSARFKRIV